MSEEVPQLAKDLFELLIRLGGRQTNRDLLKALRRYGKIDPEPKPEEKLKKRDINPLLYNKNYPFRNDGSDPPKWEAINDPEKYPAFADITGEPEEIEYYEGVQPRTWQTEALQAWDDAGKIGVVEAVTGTGKTLVGIIAAAEAAKNGYDTLVLVPTLDLLEQWHKKFGEQAPKLPVGRLCGKRLGTFEESRVIIATAQTAYKRDIQIKGEGGLLIADEAHRYGTEKFSQALKPEFSQRLALTAVYERADYGLYIYLNPYFTPPDKEEVMILPGCDYKRGLDEGILAPFVVAMVAIKFTEDEGADYLEINSKVKSLHRQLIENHGCPEAPFGEFIKAVEALSKDENNPRGAKTARAYLSAFSTRKMILANTPHKIKALEKIKDILKSANSVLVFTETIDSAKKVATKLTHACIPTGAFTSKLSKKEREDLLSRFRNGHINALAAPRVLDEGIDVPEADLGVIVAASQTRRQMIQRMGRIIRVKPDNRGATFIVLYVKETVEDPEEGAHTEFIDEMLEVAGEVKYFRAGARASGIKRWYDSWMASQS